MTKGVQHTTFYRIADKPQIKNIQHANAKAPLLREVLPSRKCLPENANWPQILTITLPSD